MQFHVQRPLQSQSQNEFVFPAARNQGPQPLGGAAVGLRALSSIYVGPCAIVVLGYRRFGATPCYPQGPVSYLCVSLYAHNGFLLAHLWSPYWRTTSSLLAPHCFLIITLLVRMLAPH